MSFLHAVILALLALLKAVGYWLDTWDLLYSERFDAFALISSDSDYTRLATRIRESGLLVVGIGEKKTPRAFVSACNVFIYTENLSRRRSTSGGSKRKIRHPHH